MRTPLRVSRRTRETSTGFPKTELTKIKGVGASTADKILELDASGTVAKLEGLREKYPPRFVELTKIPGLGPKTLKMIRSQLGVEDIEGLKEALDAEQLRELPGLGEKSEEKIKKAIDRLGLHGKDRRTPLVEVYGLAMSLARRLRDLEGVTAAEPCGSFRRFSETIGDIDIVVATEDPKEVHAAVLELDEVDDVIGSGETKTSFLTREGLQVDVRTVAPSQLGSALMYFTGSKATQHPATSARHRSRLASLRIRVVRWRHRRGLRHGGRRLSGSRHGVRSSISQRRRWRGGGGREPLNFRRSSPEKPYEETFTTTQIDRGTAGPRLRRWPTLPLLLGTSTSSSPTMAKISQSTVPLEPRCWSTAIGSES